MSSTVSLFLPQGWVRIDLLSDRATQIRRVTEERLRTAPEASRAQVATYLHAQLGELTDQLAESGAFVLAFPVVPLDGVLIQPQLTVARWELPDARDPMDVLLVIASRDETAEVLDAGELVALRVTAERDVTDETLAALGAEMGEDATGVPDGLRLLGFQARYFLGDPQRQDRWLTAVCSMTYPASEDSEDLLASMTGLFDELVTAIGWHE